MVAPSSTFGACDDQVRHGNSRVGGNLTNELFGTCQSPVIQPLREGGGRGALSTSTTEVDSAFSPVGSLPGRTPGITAEANVACEVPSPVRLAVVPLHLAEPRSDRFHCWLDPIGMHQASHPQQDQHFFMRLMEAPVRELRPDDPSAVVLHLSPSHRLCSSPPLRYPLGSGRTDPVRQHLVLNETGSDLPAYTPWGLVCPPGLVLVSVFAAVRHTARRPLSGRYGPCFGYLTRLQPGLIVGPACRPCEGPWPGSMAVRSSLTAGPPPGPVSPWPPV